MKINYLKEKVKGSHVLFPDRAGGARLYHDLRGF